MPYDANDPHSQLWIHLTAWPSILYAYEKFGPGQLSEAQENRYWDECAVAAEPQTCDPADVPRTREGVREHFETMRSQLRGSEVAKSTMDHLLHAEVMFPPVPRVFAPISWVVSQFLRTATVATMPHWMREMSGLQQSRARDIAIVPVMKAAFRTAALSPHAAVLLLGQISPATVSVAAPVLLGVMPVKAETSTPAQARERYGYDRPAEAQHGLRTKQRARVLEQGQAPSDEGLRESGPILGLMA